MFVRKERAVLLSLLSLCVISGFVYVYYISSHSLEIEADVNTLFYSGEFYFNHDDDPDGEYDLREARGYYEALLTEDPAGNEIAWYQLGRIDFLEGDFDAALYKFEKQEEYFPDSNVNSYYMIGLTHGYKARVTNNPEDWRRGEEAFIKFIEFEKQAPWPRVDLAWIYFAQGKYEEMKPTLEEGLTHYPDNAWLLNMYGLALLNTDDKLGAKVQFEQATAAADLLTTQDWGNAYPGNDPDDWEQGLEEFRAAIQKNIALVSEQ